MNKGFVSILLKFFIIIFATSSISAPDISGNVFNDADGDGIKDVGESGIGNVTVRVWQDVNTNGVVDVATDVIDGTITTDGNGAYSISVTSGNDYIVDITADFENVVIGFQNTTPKSLSLGTVSADNSSVNFGLKNLKSSAGSISSTIEINDTTPNGPILNNGDNYGHGMDYLGDLDGDGVQDLVVGANQDDTGGSTRGAVHISFMNSDGSVKSTVEINDSTPNGPNLADQDRYGSSVSSIGDLDGDGVQDLVVGATNDAGSGSFRGAVHISFLNSNGSVKSTVEINDTTPNGPNLADGDKYGISVENLGDLDGDGIQDLAVGARFDDGEGTQRGAVHISFLNSDGSVKSTVEINDTTPNGPNLADNDLYGVSVENLGDLDGDGVQDLAVGAYLDDGSGGSGADRGAFYIHFMNTNGTIKSTVKINDTTPNGPNLANLDRYGNSIENLGDLDGDGVQDLAVSAYLDDGNGGSGADRGAFYIHFMNTNGTIKSTVEINDTTPNGPNLADGDKYAWDTANLGDLDGDGVLDFASTAFLDDGSGGSGADRGAIHISFFTSAQAEPLVFRVERSTGDVFAAGSFMPGGADIAERINVSERVEPGDVVELDPTKPQHYRKARGSSHLIAGIITLKPGFILGNSSEEMEAATIIDAESPLMFGAAGKPMLALMGRVPVKATTENGAIRPGDLLTISSKRGYAMRCAEAKSCEGAIIGKALEGLEKGERLILVLVMSH